LPSGRNKTIAVMLNVCAREPTKTLLQHLQASIGTGSTIDLQLKEVLQTLANASESKNLLPSLLATSDHTNSQFSVLYPHFSIR